MSVTHDTFTIERSYGQRPAQTFSAFADPELKRRWFGNPEGWTDVVHEMDFREGGHELSSATHGDGSSHRFECRFHHIEQDERIVFAYRMSVNDVLLSVSLTTIEFAPEGDGTRLVFTEQGAFFDDHEDPAQREHGTRELLDGLGRFLEAVEA